jgi:hypothetical protein
VFSIHPYEIDFFQDMSTRAADIDLTDLQGKSAEVLKMHKWLRSPHMLRTDQYYTLAAREAARLRAGRPEFMCTTMCFPRFSQIRVRVDSGLKLVACVSWVLRTAWQWQPARQCVEVCLYTLCLYTPGSV